MTLAIAPVARRAGAKRQRATPSRAALSRILWPLDSTTVTEVTRPSGATVTRSMTVPSSPALRASIGYGGLAPLITPAAIMAPSPAFFGPPGSLSSGAVGVASWVVVPAGLVSAAAERGVLSALFWVASLLNGTGVAAVEALGSTTWGLLGLGASLSSRFSLGTLNGPIPRRPADGGFLAPVSAGAVPLPKGPESRGRAPRG